MRPGRLELLLVDLNEITTVLLIDISERQRTFGKLAESIGSLLLIVTQALPTVINMHASREVPGVVNFPKVVARPPRGLIASVCLTPMESVVTHPRPTN